MSDLLRWRSALLSKRGPPSTTRLVLLALASHGDINGREIFPSTRTLAVETGLSRRSVMTHLQCAEELGWVERTVTPSANGRGWKRHSYSLQTPDVVKEVHQERGEGGSPRGPEVVKDVHREGGENDDGRGEPHARRGENDDTEVVKEVHLTSSTTSNTTTDIGSAKKKRASRLPDSWEPTEEHVARASEYELSLTMEAEKFRLHASEKGRTAKCWNSAFTRWLMNAYEWSKKRNGSSGSRGYRDKAADTDWDAEARRINQGA